MRRHNLGLLTLKRLFFLFPHLLTRGACHHLWFLYNRVVNIFYWITFYKQCTCMQNLNVVLWNVAPTSTLLEIRGPHKLICHYTNIRKLLNDTNFIYKTTCTQQYSNWIIISSVWFQCIVMYYSRFCNRAYFDHVKNIICPVYNSYWPYPVSLTFTIQTRSSFWFIIPEVISLAVVIIQNVMIIVALLSLLLIFIYSLAKSCISYIMCSSS